MREFVSFQNKTLQSTTTSGKNNRRNYEQDQSTRQLQFNSVRGHCPCGGNCPRCLTIQTKSKCNVASNQYEDEADQNARQVTTQTSMSALQPYLKNVNIHHDASSARKTEALNAHAFTVGNDIYFNRGAFNPGTIAGRQLLVHELTHVEQQKQSGRICCQKQEKEEDSKEASSEKFDNNLKVVEKIIEKEWESYISQDKKDEILKDHTTYEKNQEQVISNKLDYSKELALAEYRRRVKGNKSAESKTGLSVALQFEIFQELSGNDVPAYYDHLNEHIYTQDISVPVIAHEAMHFYSSIDYGENVGRNLDEGTTEYFAHKVINIYKKKHGETQLLTGAYKSDVQNIKKILKKIETESDVMGNAITPEMVLARAYFQGDEAAIQKILLAKKQVEGDVPELK